MKVLWIKNCPIKKEVELIFLDGRLKLAYSDSKLLGLTPFLKSKTAQNLNFVSELGKYTWFTLPDKFLSSVYTSRDVINRMGISYL